MIRRSGQRMFIRQPQEHEADNRNDYVDRKNQSDEKFDEATENEPITRNLNRQALKWRYTIR